MQKLNSSNSFKCMIRINKNIKLIKDVKSRFNSSGNAVENESEKLTTNSRKKYNKPPPIDLKSVRTNQQVQEASKNQNQRQTNKINAIALLSIPLVTFGLGIWQVKRREQKMELIRFLEQRTTSEPRELPKEPTELEHLVEKYEYQPFRVRGHFLHSKEIILSTRHDTTGTTHLPGGYVITPFLVKDRSDNLIIMINRGHVPYTHYSPITRSHAQIDSEVEIVGFLRSNEVTNTFTPLNKPPNEWHYRDLKELAKSLGTAPIFLDANRESSIRGGPVGGQTRVILRNDHFSYITTWFGLSALTSFIWWRRFVKALF